MLMNYSEHKEVVQEFYQDLESPLDEIGYIVEGEYISYKGYDFLDKCCIFINLAKIIIDDNTDIFEI